MGAQQFSIRGVWLDSIIIIVVWFIEISELDANNEDPDQTPRSAASDQGLHCLQMSLLWDARLSMLGKFSADDILKYLIFLIKQALAFHVICFLGAFTLRRIEVTYRE